jgi:hypothetical protein
VIKSRKIRWAGYAAFMGEMTIAYRISGVKAKRKWETQA